MKFRGNSVGLPTKSLDKLPLNSDNIIEFNQPHAGGEPCASNLENLNWKDFKLVSKQINFCEQHRVEPWGRSVESFLLLFLQSLIIKSHNFPRLLHLRRWPNSENDGDSLPRLLGQKFLELTDCDLQSATVDREACPKEAINEKVYFRNVKTARPDYKFWSSQTNFFERRQLVWFHW